MKITLLFLLLLTTFNPKLMAAELESSNIKGLPFSYMDVEKNCSVQRDGQQSLSIECKGNNLKSVTRSCNGFISHGLESAKLNCGGSLWVLNQKCKIQMRGANHGEISCTI